MITTGRTVLYTLSEQDAEHINRRRTTGSDIAARMKTSVESQGHNPLIFGWPAGAQAHIGNTAAAGDVVPLVVVRVWPHKFGQDVPGVNGQAFLDGNDTLWVTSAKEGTEPGTWAWPPRV
jgi:hypothetical protein